jgi:hypothetical protein
VITNVYLIYQVRDKRQVYETENRWKRNLFRLEERRTVRGIRKRVRLGTWSRRKQSARNAETCTGQKGKPQGVKLKKSVIITVTWHKPEATAFGK